jgi:hypothetical protein
MHDDSEKVVLFEVIKILLGLYVGNSSCSKFVFLSDVNNRMLLLDEWGIIAK